VTVLGDAYSKGASAWADGPERVYARLAERLVAFSPFPWQDRLTLDLGTGTGAGSTAARAAGARVVAVDLAPGMLAHDREHRPPGVAGDMVLLPFAADTFDVVLAPFSLNHLADPAAGVRESGRVGHELVASTYAADDDHPAKEAVEVALAEQGWTRPDWYAAVKGSMAAWGTVDSARDAVVRGGMRPTEVERLDIALPELGPADMVAWRVGLAHSAAFFEGLEPSARRRVVDRALQLLGPDPAPIVRSVIFLAAT
jgi:SAM-dependent methyltransferase